VTASGKINTQKSNHFFNDRCKKKCILLVIKKILPVIQSEMKFKKRISKVSSLGCKLKTKATNPSLKKN
jgi:hypothetical protein